MFYFCKCVVWLVIAECFCITLEYVWYERKKNKEKNEYEFSSKEINTKLII